MFLELMKRVLIGLGVWHSASFVFMQYHAISFWMNLSENNALGMNFPFRGFEAILFLDASVHFWSVLAFVWMSWHWFSCVYKCFCVFFFNVLVLAFVWYFCYRFFNECFCKFLHLFCIFSYFWQRCWLGVCQSERLCGMQRVVHNMSCSTKCPRLGW